MTVLNKFFMYLSVEDLFAIDDTNKRLKPAAGKTFSWKFNMLGLITVDTLKPSYPIKHCVLYVVSDIWLPLCFTEQSANIPEKYWII